MKDPRTHSQGRWELDGNATLRLSAGGDGIVVETDRGTVLVTREGDSEDHIVIPGEPLLVTGRGLVVAWALTPAVLRVARGSRSHAESRAMRAVA